MGTFKEGFSEVYDIGKLKIKLSQPKSRKCENDYLIYWNETHQFSDIHLFHDLDINISNEKEMQAFLKCLNDSTFITFTKSCVETNITTRKAVIDYVNKTSLNDTLKLCLASIIFRCNIDNINYTCPKLNGCIRHYIQILSVFGYKFDIDSYKLPVLSPFIKDNNYCKVVSDSGYPWTDIGKKVGLKPFKDKYTELMS